MVLRRSEMSLGGKLSLAYLFAATFLWVSGGRSSEWFLTVFGFPLIYATWLSTQIIVGVKLSPTAAVTLLVFLWVGNAYLWGHLAAVVARRIERRTSRSAHTPNRPGV